MVVDDEEHILELVELYLGKEGFKVCERPGREVGHRKVLRREAGLAGPRHNATGQRRADVLREIRRASQVPVIMLTARESEVDKVLGLELGADDYLTKPFSPREPRRASQGGAPSCQARLG